MNVGTQQVKITAALVMMSCVLGACETQPVLFGSAGQLNGDDVWISATSCSEMAEALVNEAIEANNNVEAGRAWGLSQAALMVDQNCTAARIAQAQLSSANAEWGSRATRLSQLEGTEMTASEAAWFGILSAPSADERQALCETAATELPNDAAFSRCAIPATAEGMTQLAAWASQFPSLAASAHNTLAYAYGQGSWGAEVDQEQSRRYLDMYLEMYDGPNAYDSAAELAHTAGNDSLAFQYQLSAIDRGGILYQANAVRYRRFSQLDDFEATITEASSDMVAGILLGDEGDAVARQHLADEFIICYSSMAPCEQATPDMYLARTSSLDWQSAGLDDISVVFGPDMLSAMTHGRQSGSYLGADGELVEYSTRVTMVWDLSGAAPEIIQMNFAPMGGSGIPSAN